MTKLEARFDRDILRDFVGGSISLFQLDATGQATHVVTGLTMEPYERAAYYSPPVSLSEEAVQRIMNDMWAAGIRPTGVTIEPQVSAYERHIEDLRTVAFHALKVKR